MLSLFRSPPGNNLFPVKVAVPCVWLSQISKDFFRKLQQLMPKLSLTCLLAALAISHSVFAESATNPAPLNVTIQVHADKPLGELTPIWRFFGADEPNYATMKNGRKLLGELGALRTNQVYFRAHNLLCSGDGTPALKWAKNMMRR